MRTRSLPILLPPLEYKKLCELAESQDRDPAQQARFIVRQAIQQTEPREATYSQQVETEAVRT